MAIGASDGLSPLGAQTLCDSRIEKRQSTPCQDPNAPSDPIRGECVDWAPKLWAAIAAVEIDQLGEPASTVVDTLLEHRLEQLGGDRAVELYHATSGALSWIERRAWLLGEIETRGELAAELPSCLAALVDRARPVASREAKAMRARIEALTVKLEEARARYEEAELKVGELLDRLGDERWQAEVAERRRANAEAVASEQARALREVGKISARWAPCVDATNTGDES